MQNTVSNKLNWQEKKTDGKGGERRRKLEINERIMRRKEMENNEEVELKKKEEGGCKHTVL